MPIPVTPSLVANSIFLRLAQRRFKVSREALAVIAMELQKGTSLRDISGVTGIRYAIIKSLMALPWQAALFTPEQTGLRSGMDAMGGTLSSTDEASIGHLFQMKIKAADIAVYMRLPRALVRAYLKRFNAKIGTPDEHEETLYWQGQAE